MKIPPKLLEILVAAAIICVVVAMLLSPGTSSHDRWRHFSRREREIATEIEKRGVLLFNIAGSDSIEFPIAGDSALVTDYTLEVVRPKILSELTVASVNFKQRLGFTLANTRVTDAGLAHLAELTMLRRLVLPEKTTDAGLLHVAEMTELDDISLFWTQVTDAGIDRLLELKKVRSLGLPGNLTAKNRERLQAVNPDVAFY